MDENESSNQCYLRQKHNIWKCVCCALMMFLGSFLAFYVVSDWHLKRVLDPAYQMRRMDKMFMHEQNRANKMFENQAKKDFAFQKESQRFIRAEKDGENYKIIIDLKPFDNDEKNIEVTTENNVLTINAAGMAKRHGGERIMKITQNYIFNDDVDLSKITKIRQGNEYIVFIPSEK